MTLPFTPAQFFEVFRRYNDAIWPMQIALEATALGIVLLLWLRPRWGSRAVAAALAGLWLWMGAAYHLAFFRAINPAAILFAALCFIGAAGFAWTGVVRGSLRFGGAGRASAIAGAALLSYALMIYPAIGIAVGQSWMQGPTFGAPCPTTIFTLGLLMFAQRPYPAWTFVPPILWALIGTQAAMSLGVPQDFGLLAAVLVVTLRLLADRRASLRPRRRFA
jgi:hypothetical protein